MDGSSGLAARKTKEILTEVDRRRGRVSTHGRRLVGERLVTLIDRLVHKSEIIDIKGESYRLKEAKEREKQREVRRRAKKKRGKKQK